MEVLTSAWFIFILCCTDLLGFRQCTAYPVPNLLSFESPKNNWIYKYRESRNPILFYDKYPFSGGKETLPIVQERAAKVNSDSGKIFFPDEISSPAKGAKPYYFGGEDARPVWKTRNRPTSTAGQSNLRWTDLDDMNGVSTVDGSMEHQTPQLPFSKMENVVDENDDTIRSSMSSAKPSSSSASSQNEILNLTEEEQNVAAAVRQFYEWIKRTKPFKNRPSGRHNFGALGKPCPSSFTNNNTDKYVSDQSLTAALDDQKCPDGQIRVKGECKVKVEV